MTSPSEKIGVINLTPLIDILLVLLVIFMVITPLSSRGITANLPRQATGARSLPGAGNCAGDHARSPIPSERGGSAAPGVGQ
jgi:biopolymer transport protein ExbD